MEYTWKIKSLIKQNTNDLDNVIVGTRWAVSGTNEDGITGEFQGATPLELNSVDTDNFTPFENLTETQVLGWIQSKVSGSAVTSYWDHTSPPQPPPRPVNKYRLDFLKVNTYLIHTKLSLFTAIEC